MKRLLPFLFFAIWMSNVQAQSISPEVIATAGETFQGTNIQIDWTLGELAITSLQNNSAQITQGFHQPIYIISDILELPPEIGKIQAFPNPTTDRIEMKLTFDESRKVEIRLVDINGKLIWNSEDNGNQIKQITEIGHLANGTYFLNFLIDGNQYSKSFKIQKIN